MQWQLGEGLRLVLNDAEARVESSTTVWWRRTGWPEVQDLSADEQEMAVGEARALFLGILTAEQPRWVDEPAVVERAELKLHQLATARTLGIAVPETIVTNRPSVAAGFAAARSVVAKPASSGLGSGPFAAVIERDLLPRVEVLPTLLQVAVSAQGDVRVITIGDEAFVWRRPRLPHEALDWRQTDPEGSGFVPVSSSPAEPLALRLCRALGLSFSVQDWLEAEEGLVFLEVNPQGNWLFLKDSTSSILPRLARHLLGA